MPWLDGRVVPELPEVETIRAQLAPRLEGRVLARVEILDPRLTRPHDLFEVARSSRATASSPSSGAGSTSSLRLESGLGLLVHLRMTGSFGFVPVSHERAIIELDDGTRLAYRDVRRFGTWLVLEARSRAVPGDEERARAARPRALPPAGSQSQLARRTAPLKAVLLDQRVVAGLGNIYADEALWRARLGPCGLRTRSRPRRSFGSPARSARRCAPASSGRARR